MSQLRLVFALLMVAAFMPVRMAAQGSYNDPGVYTILSAQYGTSRQHVDVTDRLKQLAHQARTFRMGNSTFGVDPEPGHDKTLRIFARGPDGQDRMFEYREGSTVDGAQFRSWDRGEWGNGGWNGNWDGGYREGNDRDSGQYVIVSAQYGTSRRHVDVTDRLKELARQDRTFRMGNSTFGVDPDKGEDKMLRIYARGPNGPERMFEYREGSMVDGSQFRSWGGGDWGSGGWSGNWEPGGGGGRGNYEPQPEMTAAIQHLREAERNLQLATHDKGGHRENAIRLIDQALGEVQMGIQYDNTH
jgi:hypothetical protein